MEYAWVAFHLPISSLWWDITHIIVYPKKGLAGYLIWWRARVGQKMANPAPLGGMGELTKGWLPRNKKPLWVANQRLVRTFYLYGSVQRLVSMGHMQVRPVSGLVWEQTNRCLVYIYETGIIQPITGPKSLRPSIISIFTGLLKYAYLRPSVGPHTHHTVVGWK